MNVFINKKKSCDLWDVSGSFGKLDCDTDVSENSFSADNGKVSVISEITKSENGVKVRRDKVTNISDEPVCLHTLTSKFTLTGGEYEVYSQYNGWQNESTGAWQTLVTEVSARCESVRNAYSAAPFMAVWSLQTCRGVAFHLSAFSSWEMHVRRVYYGGECARIEVELGVLKDGLCLTLAPGEEVALPEIIYYDFRNKTDMDCHLLHAYLNEKYPRRTLPVVYNTWLYKFDHFTYEDLMRQVGLAAKIGAEYFVIDAGWFGGETDWWSSRGDWEETQTVRVCGKTAEISRAVHEKGMKFGFWLEPEAASCGSKIFASHPEYFVEGDGTCFLDFSNPEAFDYIFEKTCELIDRFSAEFIKFDFNADLKYDKDSCAFMRYFEGHSRYISALRKKYPDIYLENCASGGMRMTLRDGAAYDGFWISDNQSPFHGMRMYADTVLRMPPQWIERWAAIRSLTDDIPAYGGGVANDKIISVGDSSWDGITEITKSYLKGFLTGGTIGLSCDLGSLSETTFSDIAGHIEAFKADRDFWSGALCHVLCNTKSVIVLEYRNKDLSDVRIVAFVGKVMQQYVSVFPVLDADAVYSLADGRKMTGKEIDEKGIDLYVDGCFKSMQITMRKE
ncbi:MAG: alpha-galactosidase [Clostridia bacterium]|nr:alpha-galactosidase [Clostridia bacterium]